MRQDAGLDLWLERLRRLLNVLRPDAIAAGDEEHRSRERYRRAGLTALAAVAARAVAMATSLITVPLTVNYLGTERYGLWMAISSIIAMLAFADLGLGNGLMNAVSDAHGRDDPEDARRYVSSAFFMLLGLAILLGGLFTALYPYVPWQRVFNVRSPEAVLEAGPAMAVFVACFLTGLPLATAQRVHMGYQEGYINSLWIGLGNVLGLAGVLLGIVLEVGLPWLVLAMAGGPVVAAALNWGRLFLFERPELRPRIRSARRGFALRVLRLGLLFFVLDIAVAFAYSSDNIIAAQILGPEAVTQYAVPMKLFQMAPIVMAMFLMPLWPAYGEAIARGDTAWVRRTLMRSLGAVLVIAGPASLVLVFFGEPILHLWVGDQIQPTFLLLAGMGVWALLSPAGNALAMFFNGAHVIRFQVFWAIIMTVAAVTGKIVLARVVGLPGIIWATVGAYAVLTLLPYGLHVRRLLVRVERGELRGLGTS